VSARHATIYTVGVLSNSNSLFDLWCRRHLSQLAEATGGMLRLPAPNELGRALSDINRDLRNQYSLGYYAPEGNPGWRHLRVSLAATQPPHELRYKQRYLCR
jgi:hypothetical protein